MDFYRFVVMNTKKQQPKNEVDDTMPKPWIMIISMIDFAIIHNTCDQMTMQFNEIPHIETWNL